MSIYDDLKPVAAEIMKEFKQGSVALVPVVEGIGPIDEPVSSLGTHVPLDATVKGVSQKYMKNSNVLATDLMVTAAVVSGVEPSGKDFITIDSVRHKIIEVMKLPASGTTLVWKFIVRKGG